MSNQTHWQFSGTVQAVDVRTSKTGKPFAEIVIDQPGAKYPSICVATFWGTLPAGVARGAEVIAEGYMNGREYNGKYYAGLRCTFIKAVAVQPEHAPERKADHAPADPANESSGGDSELPF
jgi:hypothetical protein